MFRRIFVCVAFWIGLSTLVSAEEWKPAAGRIMTRWAKEVSPTSVLPEHPRPHMVRKDWQSLNGLWDYAIRPRAEAQPEAWDGKILVPFAVESALSGVMKNVGEKNKLWYRRTFPAPKSNGRLLLHFEAVDWAADVFVNGRRIAGHTGGYDPFSVEITTALKPVGEQELVVAVYDPTDASHQPRGKQVAKPNSIWYTPVTGIWQTVWLEEVGVSYIQDVQITPDVDASSVQLNVQSAGGTLAAGPARRYKAIVLADGKEVIRSEGKAGEPLAIKIPQPKLWSPDQPFLYDLRLELDGGDVVQSYFALRKISLGKDKIGVNRLLLNNQPLFHLGPLDQGWWPDGLYTAPTDAALKYDIEITKKLGFNMCRKHVKVESARWYYWCDKLGLLVWQDMPSGDKYIGPNDKDYERTAEAEECYRREWKAIINARRNHPSIVCWVPFNEGWGQFQTNEILAWTKELDPTRLVDGPSGWADRGGGDMHDMHAYPGPGMPKVEAQRAVVLGEFGGLGLPLAGHLWVDKDNWGYQNFKDKESLTTAYKNLFYKMQGLYAQGLAAAVYTQTTDVEIEVNGLLTYDREIIKVPVEEIAALHRTFYAPPLKFTEVVATSEDKPQTWKYTEAKPSDDWTKPGFDDREWKEAPGGFGTAMTPGTRVRTEWKSNDIWLRRTFSYTGDGTGVRLKLHHDEDAEVYLNGEKIAELSGFTTGYVMVPLNAAAIKALRQGNNSLAVHCKQTAGGQYIDVGLVEGK